MGFGRHTVNIKHPTSIGFMLILNGRLGNRFSHRFHFAESVHRLPFSPGGWPVSGNRFAFDRFVIISIALSGKEPECPSIASRVFRPLLHTR
jgi:hypothetical protein